MAKKKKKRKIKFNWVCDFPLIEPYFTLTGEKTYSTTDVYLDFEEREKLRKGDILILMHVKKGTSREVILIKERLIPTGRFLVERRMTKARARRLNPGDIFLLLGATEV